jgi:hypothetical protein
MKALKPLLDLANSKDEFKLTKTASKRDNSMVFIGESLSGDLIIHDIQRDNKQITMVQIQGRGFEFMRTSPIVKVTDQTSDTILFETEGGHYKLERLNEA